MNTSSLLASAALLFAATTVVSFDATGPAWGRDQKTVSDTRTTGNSASASSKSVSKNTNDSESGDKSSNAQKKKFKLKRCTPKTIKGPFGGRVRPGDPGYGHSSLQGDEPGKDNHPGSDTILHPINGDGNQPYTCEPVKLVPSK